MLLNGYFPYYYNNSVSKNVQVCFEKDTEVTGIATQGDPAYKDNFVKEFYLEYNTTADSKLRPFLDGGKKVLLHLVQYA